MPDNRVKAEQVDLLYQHANVVLWGSLLMAVILVTVFWQQIPLPILLTWFTTITVITLLRALLVHRYHSTPRKQAHHWGNRYAYTAAIAGTVWGLGYFMYFLPDKPAFEFFSAIMYVGMISAATLSLTAYMPAYYSFVIPATLPVSIRTALEGGDIYLVIGLSYLLYLGVSMFFGNNINRLITRSIELRFENDELLENLGKQRDRAEINQKKAEQAVLAKNRFLAAASHDLRQPLHALNLFHGALGQYVSSREGGELLDKIDESSSALNHIFNSLLDLSRLDADVVEVNARHLHLDSLLKNMQAEYTPLAEAKGIEFRYEPGEKIVYSDPILLERILRNLLSNAINYTESGHITLSCHNAADNMLAISIVDTGIGIPVGELDEVFSEYHQVNNPERDQSKGLGLGLAIVQRLCKLLDVELAVESMLGEGTRFTVTVPAGDKDLVLSQTTESLVLDLKGIVVLVIDDNQDVLDGMQRLLTSWGCKPILAESAKDAIKIIVQKNLVPDVIFADFRLRNHETGTQAIETIREEFNLTIPAVIVTGDTSEERLKEVASQGLRLLHKPITPAEVRIALIQELSGN